MTAWCLAPVMQDSSGTARSSSSTPCYARSRSFSTTTRLAATRNSARGSAAGAPRFRAPSAAAQDAARAACASTAGRLRRAPSFLCSHRVMQSRRWLHPRTCHRRRRAARPSPRPHPRRHHRRRRKSRRASMPWPRLKAILWRRLIAHRGSAQACRVVVGRARSRQQQSRRRRHQSRATAFRRRGRHVCVVSARRAQRRRAWRSDRTRRGPGQSLHRRWAWSEGAPAAHLSAERGAAPPRFPLRAQKARRASMTNRAWRPGRCG